jgi:nucleoid-associated protein YgaU
MQQIERYGVIALVFLLVTIVAVSFWGDSKSPGFWSRLTGRGAKKDAVAAQTQPNPEMAVQASPPAEPAPATGERALTTELPLSAASTPAPTPAPTTGTNLVAAAPAPTTAPVSPATTPMRTTTPPQAPAPTAAPATAMVSAPAAYSAPRAPAPAVHVSAASVPTGSSTYTVQKGDSLMRIAAKTLGTKERWTEIRDVNHGVDPHTLHVGQKLVIPASAKAGADGKHVVPAKKPAIAPEKPASTSTDTYLVKKGDTLKSIAEHHLGSRERWKEIAAANPKLDPNRLAAGTTIHLPHAKSGSHVESKSEPALAVAMPESSASGRPHVR